MRIVAGQDEAVAAWAAAQLGVHMFQAPFTAFGFVDANNVLKGACVFNDYYRLGNVEMTYVGAGTLKRSVLAFMARFCFDELGASRVTAKTRRGNTVVRRLLPKYGFQFEATQKRYFGPSKGDDALVFVMRREGVEKWLARSENL